MSDLEHKCTAAGLKMTEQRRVILQVLDTSEDHPSVEDVYERAKGIDSSISIATVYRTLNLLDELDLAKRANHRPGELSAGERQRLAVARALLNRPKLILADEPTGNLDSENAAEVIRHLAEFHRSGGTVVLVTHGAAAETHADRILRLEQGRLVAD